MSRAKTSRKLLLLLLVVAALALAAVLARPAFHPARTMLFDVDTREDLAPGYVDDASRLNRTRVAEVWPIPVDATAPERQLADLLARARAESRKVSIAGARHSMGGHTIYPGGISVDMRPWNRMELDAQRHPLEASTLTEIAEECRWNQELPEEEAQLAGRMKAWAVQVQLLARSIFRTLGKNFGESLAVDSPAQR